MNKTMIYADHAATTDLSLAARDAMQPWLHDQFGNPSTLYSLAREPRKAVAHARETIAAIIGAAPEEVFFTSGGAEADNWALKGTAFRYAPGKRIITSAIEHHAVLSSCVSLQRMGYQASLLSVDRAGIVSVDELSAIIRSDTMLVSVMLANNEIGTIEPISQLAVAAHAHGVPFHTDAVQAVGHIPVDVNKLQVDMLSASAHKFNGPKGIGFLYVRAGTELLPLIDGGGQERGMRAGTENVAGIVGMAAALQEHIQHLDIETEHLHSLAQLLVDKLHEQRLDFVINGSNHRIPGSLSLSFRNADGEMLLHRLDLMGTCIATGSACNSNETEISHVIQAIQVPADYRNGTIRITLGIDNTQEQMAIIAAQIARILES